MMTAIFLQLKNAMRDKMVIISALLPVVLAIILRFYTPMIIIEPRVLILEDNLPADIIAKIEQVAEIEGCSDIKLMQNRILESGSEVAGIIYDKEKGGYRYLLQGNESTRSRTGIRLISGLIEGNLDLNNNRELEVIQQDNREMHLFFIVLTVLMALFMGCSFNGFNIVAEKEEGIDRVNQTLPLSLNTYIFHKSVLGFAGSFLISIITIGIFAPEINRGAILLFALVASLPGSILGLYLGLFSKNLISAIINTKVVLLVFIFIPVIGFLMPDNLGFLQKLFYLIPSFPVFKGLWGLLENGDTTNILLNIIIILGETLTAYLVIHILYHKFFSRLKNG